MKPAQFSHDMPYDGPKAKGEGAVPPGWDYNPSAWSRRFPVIGLVCCEAVLAIYLTLYQYQLIPNVWEPFFAGKTHLVLRSDFSYVYSIPGALFGATVYTLAAFLGAHGGEDRWRRHPWVIACFFLLVVPAGMVAIGLIVAQPVFLSAGCTLCLLFGLMAVALIGPATDEVLASLQHLKILRDEKRRDALSGRR